MHTLIPTSRRRSDALRKRSPRSDERRELEGPDERKKNTTSNGLAFRGNRPEIWRRGNQIPSLLGATRDESLKALLDVQREGEKREGARVY